MDISECRKRIDGIDEKILELFEERMDAAAEIASAKKGNGIGVTDLGREEEILRRISAKSSGELEGYSRMLFRFMIELSKERQRKVLEAEGTKPESEGAEAKKVKLLVINGPNINMLGTREPEIYGDITYEELIRNIARYAQELGAEADFFQSNHEGSIVDAIQKAIHIYDGIIINPAAYTHTSIAIPDALKACNIPAVEVHISDPEIREDYRRVSYTREACIATVKGEGVEGYMHALSILMDKLR